MFFLRQACKDRRVTHRALTEHLVRDFILALAFLEEHDRSLMLLQAGVDLVNQLATDSIPEGWRGHGEFQVVDKETNDPGAGFQTGDMAIALQSLQTLDG